MIEDVEAGKVATVIVKDMSRFGRDYLKVGLYTEILFSEKDVRLIAVNDNVDTGRGENDFTPMMNLFNEWFVKNTSKKIRAVWQAKGKSGERLAVIPPYGYCKDPYFWNTTTVHKILDAPEYLGLTINFKTWSKSYKDNRPRLNPPEKQLVFEDTHPAIIDPETWDIVRSMRQHKRRAPRYGKSGLFSGVAYCADCGNKLYFHTRSIKNKWGTRYEGSYSCSEYRKDVQYQGSRKCTCHFIRESQAVNVDRFLSVVHRYTEIETLTPAIVHEFIDRIIVHEPEQARGDRRQKVEIIYNNIGAVDRLALKGLRA